LRFRNRKINLIDMNDKIKPHTSSGCSNGATAPASSAISTTASWAVVKVRGEFVWHKHDDTDDFSSYCMDG
jgi:hypothetical protein